MQSKVNQYTTRPAAVATIRGHEVEVLDPLVSKYEYFNPDKGACEYVIRNVSAEAVLATARMPRVIGKVQSALSYLSGNQVADVFESDGDSYKRFSLAGGLASGVTSFRVQALCAIRADGSTCSLRAAVAFHALVDLYSRDPEATCKEVRIAQTPQHRWVEVLTHADERMVFETWTLFPEVVEAKDGFAYADKGEHVVHVWRPGMQPVEPWADFLKTAVAEGPIERAPLSLQGCLKSLHWDRGLQGYAQAVVEGSAAAPWDRAEACLTSAERMALGMQGHQRVVYQAPNGDTYNGDRVRLSLVDRHRRVRQAMDRVGFPVRFGAREMLRRDLSRAVQAGDLFVVEMLLKQSETLRALGPDCSEVLDDALWCAVRSTCNDRVDIAGALINAGADKASVCDGGLTLLTAAAALGDLAMVQALRRHGVDSGQRNDDGHDAFQLACYFGRVEVAKYLMDPTSLHTRDQEGRSPLMLSSQGGSCAMVRALLSAGAAAGEVNPVDGTTALSLAMISGHADVAQLLQKWLAETVSLGAADAG